MNSFGDVVDSIVNGEIRTEMSPVRRRTWPRFAYHFTDITNAVEVLAAGKLISRQRAQKSGVMRSDNASNSVIEHTDTDVQKYVRLYFRPKTPTQYYNEGFKTREQIENQRVPAYCPMPIFFLFDIEAVLALSGSGFSARSLALSDHGPIMNTVDDFQKLPFDHIYNDSALYGISEQLKRCIIAERQAEIVVRDELPLSCLEVILVRSTAERETLLTLLHDRDIDEWDDKILLGDEDTFNLERNHIQQVSLGEHMVEIYSITEDAYPAPWRGKNGVESVYALNPLDRDAFLRVQMQFLYRDEVRYIWPSEDKFGLLQSRIRIHSDTALTEYRVRVLLDGSIAFCGQIPKRSQEDDLPF